MSGRRGSGSFGSGRTAGYAIGEDRTSPWLEAIAGIRERSCPRLGSKPVPAPRTRSEVRASLSVGFSPPRLQQAPPPERQKWCAGQGVRGSSGVRASGCRAKCAGQSVRAKFPKRVCCYLDVNAQAGLLLISIVCTFPKRVCCSSRFCKYACVRALHV